MKNKENCVFKVERVIYFIIDYIKYLYIIFLIFVNFVLCEYVFENFVLLVFFMLIKLEIKV